MRTHATPRPTPPAPPLTPAPDSPTAPPEAHELARLAADLAPLAAVDDVGGLRSLYRDPRLHPAIHNTAPPEDTPLDRAVDAGTVRRARLARARLARLTPDARRAALWVAAHAGAAVDPRAWSYEYGRAEGPGSERHLEAELAGRLERAELHLRGLKHRARGKIDEQLARDLDAARDAAAALRPAAAKAASALAAWGAAGLRELASQWLGGGA